jgi:1-deoxy-D-xylulose-5-phosphate reductoisomerase
MDATRPACDNGAMKAVAILGSTGSIGTSGLQVCAAAREQFQVAALAANRSARELAAQALAWRPDHLGLVDPGAADLLHEELAGQAQGGEPFTGRIHLGPDGLLELIDACAADVYLLGITGAACLPATFAVARRACTMALANKESVVMAGPLLMQHVRRNGCTLVPVDSEHSAIFQALAGSQHGEVRRLHLTASGGPFRDTPRDEFPALTVEQALQHPTWKMGSKITIDSATMMNKALEIVEARWLFDVPADAIRVLVHPESIVHSLVEFVDGSILAQLGLPDMKVPIRYALGYPERIHAPTSEAPGLVLDSFHQLSFHEPDVDRFPALELGFRAARTGGTMGAVLNAANEEAVALFLAERVRFDQIPTVVREVMDRHDVVAAPDLATLERAAEWARDQVRGR